MFPLYSIAAAALYGFAASLALAIVTWVVSVVKRDASIVDSLWSLLILAAGATYAVALGASGPRSAWLLGVLALWALRLSIYITWRNWGEGEDRRYQAIRERNQPNFAIRSLYLVFILQAVLAWIVSLPLLAALVVPGAANWLDACGLGLAVFGLVFEAAGDAQLARFKSRAENRGRVMDQGLWRYTRHPNYFGEFCVWWGFFLVAAGASGWWSVLSPILMSVLLLKVSGVSLLEKDIAERRPQYRDYIARTNAFFPGPPKAKD